MNKKQNNIISYEFQDFVESHVCKLRMMLRSRVLRVLYDLMKDVCFFLRGTTSDIMTAVELGGVHRVCIPYIRRCVSHTLEAAFLARLLVNQKGGNTERYVFGKLSARCFKRRPFGHRHYSNYSNYKYCCGDIDHGRSVQAGGVIYIRCMLAGHRVSFIFFFSKNLLWG